MNELNKGRDEQNRTEQNRTEQNKEKEKRLKRTYLLFGACNEINQLYLNPPIVVWLANISHHEGNLKAKIGAIWQYWEWIFWTENIQCHNALNYASIDIDIVNDIKNTVLKDLSKALQHDPDPEFQKLWQEAHKLSILFDMQKIIVKESLVALNLQIIIESILSYLQTQCNSNEWPDHQDWIQKGIAAFTEIKDQGLSALKEFFKRPDIKKYIEDFITYSQKSLSSTLNIKIWTES